MFSERSGQPSLTLDGASVKVHSGHNNPLNQTMNVQVSHHSHSTELKVHSGHNNPLNQTMNVQVSHHSHSTELKVHSGHNSPLNQTKLDIQDVTASDKYSTHVAWTFGPTYQCDGVMNYGYGPLQRDEPEWSTSTRRFRGGWIQFQPLDDVDAPCPIPQLGLYHSTVFPLHVGLNIHAATSLVDQMNAVFPPEHVGLNVHITTSLVDETGWYTGYSLWNMWG
ncbi:hypothetical protein L210DRAFT_3509352 [Boletus edulis BED1]|uniref:Uncharacterized protein n=1 Tax=Boletus edulis BED1 TaxID=1328754 RepID=A0AAD4BF37_BOLED|nr:hypothetical protein L210DRAFT_3509352 [Boletus edulis BED1]